MRYADEFQNDERGTCTYEDGTVTSYRLANALVLIITAADLAFNRLG